MNIKSLVIGSAVAAVTVTGARAADAIIFAEPEPLEYVRICDTYGAGFFYIPGTETCLRIGGMVRAQVGATNYRSTYTIANPGAILGTPVQIVPGGTVIPDGRPVLLGTALPTYTAPYQHLGGVGDYPTYERRFQTVHRAEVSLDARTDTEWGTLRSWIRLRGTGTNGAAAVVINQAIIELGGLRMGWTESAWSHPKDGGAAAGGSHSDTGLYYGYQQTQLVSYTFTGGNGFHATLSLEGDEATVTTPAFWGPVRVAAGSFGALAQGPAFGRGYIPDVVAVVGVNQAWGGAWAKFGWDERVHRTLWGSAATGFRWRSASGWGAEAGVQVNVPNFAGSNLRVIGYYASRHGVRYAPRLGVVGPTSLPLLLGDPGLGFLTLNAGALTTPQWSVLASYQHRFNEQFSASIGGQYFGRFYRPTTVGGSNTVAGSHGWAAEASAVWTPITNFEVRAEYGYQKVRASGFNPRGTHSGYLRFQRNF